MCDQIQMVCAVCHIGIYSIFRRLGCVPEQVEKPEFSILCVGLSQSGKSSVLALLTGENKDGIEPTVGFSIKAVMLDNCVLNVKELGGSDTIRPYWERYYQGSEAVIYVVASSSDKMEENKTEFHKVVNHSRIKSLPLLVLITGEEKEGGRTPDEISQMLEIPSSTDKRPVFIESCKTEDVLSLKSAFLKLSNVLLDKNNPVASKDNDVEINRV